MEVQVMFWPQGKKVKVRQGTNVLRAAREARLHIATRCGGQAACLLCKVRVEKGGESALSPLSAAEARKLGALAEEGIRLACQAKVIGNAEIHLPEDPLKAAVRKKLLEQQEDDRLW
ncbi:MULTISPECIES: 2Fe-2S iron-sulfur cluster-binding protein [Paenibacillus]|uniref:2Fe-2S iron-sulfur cluster-binding protein n=1 Tax=Paenibacillus TaxID=44249 RepID=UPI002E2196B2|nr:2Fe-2S iron-sulfur cluster-binding protein [Paenibacillus macerans]MED4957921.1 2Fe-2S iron-sulfur cluster-binding protein [Paenibacillus macerans]